MERKNKTQEGGKKREKRKRKRTQKEGKKEWALNLSFIRRREAGNFKTYIQYNKLFDETQ